MRPMCFMTDVYNENHGTTSALYFALGSFVARLPRNPRGRRWPSSFRLCPALSACSPPFAVNPALSGTVRPCPPVVRPSLLIRLCPALSACCPPFAVNPALSGTVRPCPPVVRLLSALTEHLHERHDALDLFFLRQVRGVDEHGVFGL